MQNKNGFKNLKKRYMAVLDKCKLLNVFGSLAVAAMLAVPTGAEAYTLSEGNIVDSVSDAMVGNNNVYLHGFINGGSSSGVGAYLSPLMSGELFILDFTGGIFVNPPTALDAVGIAYEGSAGSTRFNAMGRVTYGSNAGNKVDFQTRSTTALSIHSAALPIALDGLGTTRYLFGTAGGAGFNVGNYTTFYARPSVGVANFGLNTAVSVSDYFQAGAFTGDFDLANYAVETPLLKVTYNPITKQFTLQKNVTDETNPSSSVGKTAIKQSRAVMRMLSSKFFALAMDRAFPFIQVTDASDVNSGMPAGSMSATSPWTLYATPYGGFASDSQYDFDMDMYGVTAGARYAFNKNFSLGFHFDYNNASADSDVIDLDIDSNLYTFGFDMDYIFNNNWYVRGDIGFALGQNNMEYNIGNVEADEDYSSTSFYTEAYVGYILQLNKNNILVPELGLSYLYSSIEDIDVNFKGAGYMGEYDMNIDSDTINSLNLNFMLNWKGNFAFGNGHVISPSVGLGISQSLTGSHIDSSLEFVGTRTKTEADIDGTSFVARAGVEWTKGAFALGIYYDGVMGGEEQFHSGQAKFSYKF